MFFVIYKVKSCTMMMIECVSFINLVTIAMIQFQKSNCKNLMNKSTV